MTDDVERAELLGTLARHRGFLIQTLDGVSDEQAASTPTVSALSLGGLIKHVGGTEKQWIDFAVGGAEAFPSFDVDNIDWSDPGVQAMMAEREKSFRLLVPDETVEGVLADYAAIAADTERRVADLDLGASHALPSAPWFEPGASWSVRRVLMHLIAETAQHSGHADIIREAIDGAKTMG